MMLKINMDAETKKNLTVFSILFGIIFGLTVILISMTLISRNSWKKGLAFEVQHVLDSYQGGTYTVTKNLQLNSTFSTSAAVYSLMKKDEQKNRKYYGVIVRMPSILGPLPGVFIYGEGRGVSFAGYAIDNGKASVTVERQLSSNILNYWEEMIPKIIEKSHE